MKKIVIHIRLATVYFIGCVMTFDSPCARSLLAAEGHRSQSHRKEMSFFSQLFSIKWSLGLSRKRPFSSSFPDFASQMGVPSSPPKNGQAEKMGRHSHAGQKNSLFWRGSSFPFSVLESWSSACLVVSLAVLMQGRDNIMYDAKGHRKRPLWKKNRQGILIFWPYQA